MTAPRRWRDSPDAPIGVRELFASSKPRKPLDDRAYRRGAERVARMGVAPAAVVTATAIWTKLAVAGGIGLVAAGALVAVELEHGRRESSSTTQVVQASPARSASPASAAPPPIAERDRIPEPELVSTSLAIDSTSSLPPREMAPPGKPVAPASRRSPAIVVAPTNPIPTARAGTLVLAAPAPETSDAPPQPAQVSTLAAELSFLEEARAHLARDPETALRHLAAHRARYPRGVLASERDLVELDALRRAGRVEDARIRARAWLERDPTGLHAARIRSILASLEAPR